jgi:hypothetical protein
MLCGQHYEQELKVDDTPPQIYDVFASITFIELCDSSLSEDWTPFLHRRNCQKAFFNLMFLCH